MGVRESLVMIMLGISSIIDIRYREVKMRLLVLFGAIGVILYLVGKPVSFIEELGGVLIGVFLLIVNRITRGAIGIGDALLIIVTGLFLGFEKNITMLLLGLLLAAVWAGILLTLKKVNGKYEIPFVPFLFLSCLVTTFIP